MFNYECFYKSKRITIKALCSFDAQEIAAKIFKAKSWREVTVILSGAADKQFDPAAL